MSLGGSILNLLTSRTVLYGYIDVLCIFSRALTFLLTVVNLKITGICNFVLSLLSIFFEGFPLPIELFLE